MAVNVPLVHISDLTEQTTAADTDLMVIGGIDAKKIKWSTIISLIKTKLNIGSSAISGIGDGTITGAISSLNSASFNPYAGQDLYGVTNRQKLKSNPLTIKIIQTGLLLISCAGTGAITVDNVIISVNGGENFAIFQVNSGQNFIRTSTSILVKKDTTITFTSTESDTVYLTLRQ